MAIREWAFTCTESLARMRTSALPASPRRMRYRLNSPPASTASDGLRSRDDLDRRRSRRLLHERRVVLRCPWGIRQVRDCREDDLIDSKAVLAHLYAQALRA